MPFGYIAGLYRKYRPVFGTGSIFMIWREARHRLSHGNDPQRVVQVRLACRPFSRIHLRAYSDDLYTSLEIFRDHVYQSALDRLGDCRCIIDLGANIGLSCLYFADRCPNVKIFALEPFPPNYKLLEQNTAALVRGGNCRTVHGAFWRDKDASLMFRLRNDNSSAAVSLEPATSADGDVVRGMTMESILAASGFAEVDLLKVDIEGAEVGLFQAPNDWLRRVRGIAVEFHGDARKESGFDQVMRDFGFQIFEDGGHTVVAIRRAKP